MADRKLTVQIVGEGTASLRKLADNALKMGHSADTRG